MGSENRHILSCQQCLFCARVLNLMINATAVISRQAIAAIYKLEPEV
ncbi:hypothetical protein [[Limnothrix rosea] IAM M-220]|nr:hypothetical protein [[Limnothrix rosea] IAM M-220]